MDNLSWVAGTWTNELVQVLEMMTGARYEARPADPEPLEENAIWWKQPFSLGPGALLAIGVPETTWLEIGARSLQAAGIDPVERDAARGTFLEVLQQSLSGLSRVLATRAGQPVDCVGGEEASRWTERPTAAFVLSAEDADFPALLLFASEALLGALTPAKPTALQQVPPPTPSVQRNTSEATTVSSKTIDVLLDVEMPVSLSFGQTSLCIKDVLKLSTGTVVELDRRPDDPVDIIVNNCVIARGEVVVIDGNYAVRIQQIVSRQQRLGLRAAARAGGRS